MPSSADLFPLDPYYTYPVRESVVSRKVRLALESGKQFIRAQGTDLRVWEISGEGSAADRNTLLQFYELHAVCGCTFRDSDYSPAEDHVVQFQDCPEIERLAYESFRWKCTLVETTVA